jgi:hypothetical protein
VPFTDVIDDYSDGATGTLTDASGDSVGYTVTGTSPTVNWNALDGGARVNGTGTQAFTITFDDPVVGAVIQISGSDATEKYFIEVNGVTVDLNTLIANGDVTFTQSGAQTHNIATDGSISGGVYRDGSIAELVFNIPVTSLGAYGSGAGSGNWDFFDVGIDDTIFNVVCFAAGTSIATDTGPRTVETLCVGDLIRTTSDESKRILWIGSRKLNAADLAKNPKLRPVRITAGALGNDLPMRDLLVSRQHRMLVSSKIAARMFGVTDVLIPAIKLTALPSIFVDEAIEEVTYFHMLFDQHEVIFAEGAPTESLFTGKQALESLPKQSLKEISAIFPELAELSYIPKPAKPLPTGQEQKQLIARHIKNDQVLLQTFLH